MTASDTLWSLFGLGVRLNHTAPGTHMAPLLHEQHLPAHELIARIRSLADEVVQSRLDSTTNPPPPLLHPEEVLAKSAPVFASLYGLSRASQLDAKECRARTHDARLEMDAAHLSLQVRPAQPSPVQPPPGLVRSTLTIHAHRPVRRISCFNATTSSERSGPPRSTRTSSRRPPRSCARTRSHGD